VILSPPSVRVAEAPMLTVGEAADLAVVKDDVLSIVATALLVGEVVVPPSGCVPEAVALLVTPFRTPAPLFTSVCVSTYVAVKICEPPGTIVALVGAYAPSVPVPATALNFGPASLGTTLVSVTLPVLVTV
jgi:hypothetical protein